ncbi:unnamed protein product [Rotaria magnacalcarata]|uniref:SCP domain-containing protein n=1 Tax=Rotaria magnacalcarata TaxID=392030 RepID=A0A815Z851_9BILA|nr:unnamed protein product [Rotaria magnacalcarata]CAF1579401.1 unnamed protein product [Rotaria magnacalcarata]CAF4175400.1 unnamed protein product [Rotaria magnacalcarata]
MDARRSKIDTRRSDTNAALSRLNKLLSNINEINESTLKRRRSPLRLNETSANTHIDSDSEDVADDRVHQSPTMIHEEDVYSHHSQHKKHKKHDQNHEERKTEEESESELSVDCSIPNECQIKVLELHNALRPKHGVPPLILDNTLSQKAQLTAMDLANTAQNQQRTYEYKQGENVYTKSNLTSIQHISIGATATQCWYGEIKDYNFNIPIFSMSTCHFTQVVWKNTTRLGVGIAFDNEGKTAFFVALYDPAGNVKEKFFQNVLPPC